MRCSKIIRGVHAVLNFFLMLIGIFLTVIAILVLFSPGTITSTDLFEEVENDSTTFKGDFRAIFNSMYLVVFAWACVVVGVIIIVLSLCGCLGSCFQSVPLLSIYLFVLILLTLIQIGCGVIIVLSPEWFRSSLNESFQDSIAGDEALRKTWASLEITFECCGVNGTDDYGLDAVTNDEDRKERLMAARSCCSIIEGSKTLALTDYLDDEVDDTRYVNSSVCLDQFQGTVTESNTNNTVWHDIGCVDKIYGDITLFGIITIAVVAIEIVIIIFSCILCCHANDVNARPI